MNAVPVVSEIIVSRRKPQPGIGDDLRRTARRRGCSPSSQRAMKNDWISDRIDAAVARVLVDPPPPLLAFFLELLELGDDDGEELQDDRRR